MLKVITLTAIAALALAVTVSSQPAFAGGGHGSAVAAGVIGGLAVGAVIGSQVNGGYYDGPGYYESGYQPAYGGCHIERQQIVDRYGNDRVRRVRVCD
jgi:hypothetical protein